MWRPPTHPGVSVDIRVSPADFVKLTNLFSKYRIRYKVQISDLQTVINRQNDAQSKPLSWHSKYHTLEQVNISPSRLAYYHEKRCILQAKTGTSLSRCSKSIRNKRNQTINTGNHSSVRDIFLLATRSCHQTLIITC